MERGTRRKDGVIVFSRLTGEVASPDPIPDPEDQVWPPDDVSKAPFIHSTHSASPSWLTKGRQDVRLCCRQPPNKGIQLSIPLLLSLFRLKHCHKSKKEVRFPEYEQCLPAPVTSTTTHPFSSILGTHSLPGIRFFLFPIRLLHK